MPSAVQPDSALPIPSRASLLIAPLLLGDALATLLYAASIAGGWWRSEGGLIWKLGTLLDANSDGSLPSWFLACQLFLVAYIFAFYVAGVIARGKKISWLLLPLPLPFAALSFDAVADLHSWVSSRVPKVLPPGILDPGSFAFRNLFPILMVCVLILSTILAYLFHPRRRPFGPVILRFSGAMTLFLLGTLSAGQHKLWKPSDAILLGTGTTLSALARLLGATALVWAAYSLTPRLRPGSLPGDLRDAARVT